MTERLVAFIVVCIICGVGALTLFMPADRDVVSALLIAIYGGGTLALITWMIVRTRLIQWIPPVAFGVVLMLIFFIFGAGLDWLPDSAYDVEYAPGLKKKPPEYIFCEGYVKDSWIMQPISVWTDLAFVVCGYGLILISSLRTNISNAIASDPPILRTPTGIPLAYSLVVIYMGPGSMYFHASLKDWCGWCDWFSIVNWAAFGLGYTLWRTIRHTPFIHGHFWPLWAIWATVAIPAAIAGAATADVREAIRMIAILVWVGAELFVVIVSMVNSKSNFLGMARDPWWFLAAVLAFAAAFGCWMPSGGVWHTWCNPDSSMQGHGFWHIFAAVGTFLVFRLWASERPA